MPNPDGNQQNQSLFLFSREYTVLISGLSLMEQFNFPDKLRSGAALRT